MKKGDLINLSKVHLCPTCDKPLHFMYESAHGDRRIAHCCDVQYNIRPSSIYEVELITGIGVSGDTDFNKSAAQHIYSEK